MAWPTSGAAGWEAFGTDITTAPEVHALPAPVFGYYYDPVRLHGIGAEQEAIVHEFHGTTIVVRRRLVATEAEFRTVYVWGDGLLDRLVVPEIGEPCTLVLDVYADDRETILWSVGTSPGHDNPYLIEPDSYAEQEVDVAAGAATVGTVSCTIIDRATIAGDQDSGWLTAKLSELGLENIRGRRCRLRRYISEELGFYVIADGPASTPRLDASFAAYTFDVRDTRDTERKIRLFDQGGGSIDDAAIGTRTLLPEGVYGGYGYDAASDTYLLDPAEPLVGVYQEFVFTFSPYPHVGIIDLTGNTTAQRLMSVAGEGQTRGAITYHPGTTSAWYTSFSGIVFRWRLAGSSDPWKEISSTLVADDEGGGLGRLIAGDYHPSDTDRQGFLGTTLYLGDKRGAADMPADGDSIEFFVLYAGAPSEDLPTYVEGITTGEFVANVYAGNYSARDEDGAIVPTGILYDPAAVALMTDPVRIRLTEPIEDARDWLETHIYAPTGWAPALDDLGRVSPVSQVAPLDVAGLTVINEHITEPVANWNAGERVINVVRFTYLRDYIPPAGVTPLKQESVSFLGGIFRAVLGQKTKTADANLTEPDGDGLMAREVVIEFRDEISITRNGELKLEIDGSAFRAIGTTEADALISTESEQAYALALLRQTHIQARYALGAPSITVPVMRTETLGLRAGSWVVLSLPWLPDLITNRRGLITLAQVTAIGDFDCKWRRVTLEVVVPLTEPTS